MLGERLPEVSQMIALLSMAPERRAVPSDDQAKSMTSSPCPQSKLNRRHCADISSAETKLPKGCVSLAFGAQRMSSPQSPALTRYLPVGEKRTQLTVRACPVSVLVCFTAAYPSSSRDTCGDNSNFQFDDRETTG